MSSVILIQPLLHLELIVIYKGTISISYASLTVMHTSPPWTRNPEEV